MLLQCPGRQKTQKDWRWTTPLVPLMHAARPTVLGRCSKPELAQAGWLQAPLRALVPSAILALLGCPQVCMGLGLGDGQKDAVLLLGCGIAWKPFGRDESRAESGIVDRSLRSGARLKLKASIGQKRRHRAFKRNETRRCFVDGKRGGRSSSTKHLISQPDEPVSSLTACPRPTPEDLVHTHRNSPPTKHTHHQHALYAPFLRTATPLGPSKLTPPPALM
ncbi:hypothetical protein B7463_g12646, partial [Scytalidium lignicola]